MTAIKLSGKAKDLTGRVFGKLTVVKPVGFNKHNAVIWECQCSCGTVTNSMSSYMIRGTKVSCGCRRSEASKEYWSRTPTWNQGKTYQIKSDTDVFKGAVGWREAAIRARGDACEICGWNEATCDVHHRIPKNRGGKNTIENAIVLCPNHHRIAHQHGLPGITPPRSYRETSLARTSDAAGELVRLMDIG